VRQELILLALERDPQQVASLVASLASKISHSPSSEITHRLIATWYDPFRHALESKSIADRSGFRIEPASIIRNHKSHRALAGLHV
jgi:hypothetical protein